MKSRFPKVWCPSCSSMQFVGSCPHGREEWPTDVAARADALERERFHGGTFELHDQAAVAVARARERERQKIREARAL